MKRAHDPRAAYVLRGLVTGLYKIGASSYPERRLNQLVCNHAESMELMAAVAGGERVERALHQRFAHLRADDVGRGREWFRDDGSIAAWLAALPECARGSLRKEWRRGDNRGVPRRPRRQRAPISPEMIAEFREQFRQRIIKLHGHDPDAGGIVCRLCALNIGTAAQFRERAVLRRPAFLRALVAIGEG